MASLFQRYASGEHAEVWNELTLLGVNVRKEPFIADARAVAHETMRRARYNIDLLVPRLKEVGYQFGTLGSENSGQWYGERCQADRRCSNDLEMIVQGLLPL